LSFGGADEAEDLLIAIELLAGRVLGRFREEAVFGGIPFGSTGWIVGNSEEKAEGVGQLRL
jgi:hypothetical protein